jgi:hypothetical protein
MNYLIVLFKNKVKKKIIKKFKTSNRANNFYESLLSESNDVIFNKEYENGVQVNYEIAILEKTSGTFLPVFLKDELGRNIKVKLEDSDFSIKKINPYYVEELILDITLNKKINSLEFIKLYLDCSGLKLLSKLNNKIVIQNDNTINLFTLKNDYDSSRFIDVMSEIFMNHQRLDGMFVKDYSNAQRKYLYNILIENGYSKNYLQRQSTTHPSIKT